MLASAVSELECGGTKERDVAAEDGYVVNDAEVKKRYNVTCRGNGAVLPSLAVMA